LLVAPAAFVHEADVELGSDVEPGSVGAAVTAALCGSWDHDGPCRWPHNNAISNAAERFTFRTLFVAPEHEHAQVRSLIDAALAGHVRRVLRSGGRAVAADERDLAERLARIR